MAPRGLVVNVRPATYRYTLRSAPSYGWRTGVLRDGRQVIAIGPSVVLFDPDGTCRGWQRTDAAFPAGAGWPAAEGFAERAITVERFRVPDRCIFIEDVISAHGEFLADPDSIDPRERAECASDIEGWLESGLFVFSAGGNEYYVDQRGVVVSS